MKGVAQPESLHKTWTTNRVNSKWPTGHISGRTNPTGGSIATQISNGTYAAHSRTRVRRHKIRVASTVSGCAAV
jgi:hypothetical protein